MRSRSHAVCTSCCLQWWWVPGILHAAADVRQVCIHAPKPTWVGTAAAHSSSAECRSQRGRPRSPKPRIAADLPRTESWASPPVAQRSIGTRTCMHARAGQSRHSGLTPSCVHAPLCSGLPQRACVSGWAWALFEAACQTQPACMCMQHASMHTWAIIICSACTWVCVARGSPPRLPPSRPACAARRPCTRRAARMSGRVRCRSAAHTTRACTHAFRHRRHSQQQQDGMQSRERL